MSGCSERTFICGRTFRHVSVNVQTAVARSVNHRVLTHERLAMLHTLNNVYKTPNKKVLGEDFRLRKILNYEHVPPPCMKVCLFFMLV